jgi:hypothetical protein
MPDDLTPLQAAYFEFGQSGLAIAGTVAVLLAVVLGMFFIKALWS